MQVSKKELLKKIVLIIISIATFITCTNFSLEPEDSKYVLALILFFPFCFFFFRSSFSLESEKKSRDFSIVFGCYTLYILSNWYLMGKGYYGLRGISYQWICLLSFVSGVLVFQRGKQILIVASIIAGTIGSFFAIGEYFAFFSYNVTIGWPPIVTGLFAHKNPFILFLIWSLTWSVYYTILYKKRIIRMLLIFAMILQFYTLTISGSRGGLILAIFTVVLIFIPMLKKSSVFNKSRNRIIAYVTLFLIALVPIVSWNDLVWNRLAALSLTTSDWSFKARVELYKAELKLIQDKPIFGCGIGNFVYDNIHYWSQDFRKNVPLSNFPRNAECEYLEVLTEQGFVGFAFFVFFITGSIILAIKKLKAHWQWDMYILLVLLIIMLLNGIYDTGLRRLPLAIVFWIIIGYFWQEYIFPQRGFPQKGFRYVVGMSICVHVLITALFVKLLIADSYYILSIKDNNTMQSGKNLIKALTYYPDHPDALYRFAFMSAKNGDHKNVYMSGNRLEKISSDYRPVNFVYGYAAYNRSQFDTALYFANKELEKNPNFVDARELRLMALSKLHMCKELNSAQDSLAISIIGCREYKKYTDTVSINRLQKEYVDQTGKLRTIIGGNAIKNAYKKYRNYNTWSAMSQCEQTLRITTIRCNDENPISK